MANRDGMAQIKSEFLITDFIKSEVVTEFVSEEVKEELQQATKDGHNSWNNKIKLKGRNKKRPQNRINVNDKLCPNFINGNCTYGEKCRYSHDVKGFLSTKREDISQRCVLFELYGKCKYGISCRFGSCHLKEDGENVIIDDKEKYPFTEEDQVKNMLTLELKRRLWKRKYEFSKASAVLDGSEYKKSKDGKEISGCNSATKNIDSTKKNSEDSINANVEKSDSNPVAEICDVKQAIISTDSPNQIDAERVDTTSDTMTSDVVVTSKELESDASDCSSLVVKPLGSLSVNVESKRQPIKNVDFRDKLFLAPLTTVGNLPFRRICKEFGADITCGEMAMCTNLLQGQQSEWALVRRHHTEDIFGIQLCGGHVDTMTRCAELLNDNVSMDFVDINCGCPIDVVFEKGEGCGLMGKAAKLATIVSSMKRLLDVPVTVKMRTAIYNNKNLAHNLIERLESAGASLITIHGRSREQRYTRSADWDYINMCSGLAKTIPIFGNGDVLSYHDYKQRRAETGVAGAMVARGALIKPWIFREMKESRDWDITATERLDVVRKYVDYGLEHWGSDDQGVEVTRRFLLEWLSFAYRYIPVGVLEHVPQKINAKPPHYRGRDDLETLLSSGHCGDWIKISEMFLGRVPDNFNFLPKHKANAYK